MGNAVSSAVVTTTPLIDLKFTGFDDLARTLNQLADEYDRQAEAILVKAGQIILAESNLHTPRRTGKLVESGKATLTNSGGGSSNSQLSVAISYGDNESGPYAVAVHEHPGPYDPWSWQVAGDVHFTTGGPKFLENAIRNNTDLLPRLLSEMVVSVHK